jgi:hypothetical protein
MPNDLGGDQEQVRNRDLLDLMPMPGERALDLEARDGRTRFDKSPHARSATP